MKIIHVGNFDRSHNFQTFYHTDHRIFFGLVRNGHMVLQFSDRDTARESNFLHSKNIGKVKLNKKLIDTCREVSPDLIMLGHTDLLSCETIETIRDYIPDIKIAQYNVDPIFSVKSMDGFKRRIGCTDSSFITTAGPALKKFHKDNHVLSFIPNPVDPAIDTARNFELSNLKYDVGFSSSGPYRSEIILWLMEHLHDARFNWIGRNDTNRLYGKNYMDFISSVKIGLNLPHSELPESKPYLYSSDRMAHYLGNGLLVFLDNSSGFQDFFSKNEAVFFGSKEELLEKLEFYLNNDKDRQSIAKNGHSKVHTFYSSDLVTKYMIERTFNRDLSESYMWPTELW
ncbi:MAG: glycosyltransferase [Candidatus Sedimenticola sp. (ex Thyasira tokunagai)]